MQLWRLRLNIEGIQFFLEPYFGFNGQTYSHWILGLRGLEQAEVLGRFQKL